MSIRRLCRDAVLTAVALTIFIVELQLPELVPIPGVKLGLANIVTVTALFTLGPADALAILLCRIILGSLFSGNMMALLYSLSGGLLSFLVMLLLRKILTEKQLWAASVFAAAAHNLGQILAAVAVTATPSLMLYLPVLVVSGVVTGLFTGAAAQFAVKRLSGVLRK